MGHHKGTAGEAFQVTAQAALQHWIYYEVDEGDVPGGTGVMFK
jgi:hypothetical protein